MPTSSKQEDQRYLVLKHNKKITCLERQVTFRPVINGVNVFKYTADFAYIENGERVIEEYKGFIYERHDYELRMKICSACYPQLTFRIVLGSNHKLHKTFKAGKIVREKVGRRGAK